MRKKNTKKKYSKGFSLVEFIVVLVIFSIMSSVSLFNYNSYSKSIRETNVAQDIALTIRQAQIYGLSATGRTVGGGNAGPEDILNIPNITQDRSIIGVRIDIDNDSLTLYEDINRNFVFDEGGNYPDRVIDIRTIRAAGIDILAVDLCDDAPNCANDENGGVVDVAFMRPYPDAYISYDGDGSDRYNFGSILISGNDEFDKYIEISSIGNISVKNNYDG